MMSEQDPLASNPAATPPGARSCRSLKLAWTDADSGQELIVSFRGGAQLLRGLEQVGFRRIETEPAGAPARCDGETLR